MQAQVIQKAYLLKVYPEIPPKVEYAITEKGRKAIPVIETLRIFGEEFRNEEII